MLLNAGRSPRGREFAIKNCDIAFVSAHNPDALKKQVEEYRNEARVKFGREIQVWMSAYVVLKDTMEEAKAYAYDYIVAQGDDAPVQTIIKNNAIDTKSMPPMRQRNWRIPSRPDSPAIRSLEMQNMLRVSLRTFLTQVSTVSC